MATARQNKFEQKASKCATLEERPEFALLPNPHNKHYLRVKTEFSLNMPRKTVRVMNGEMVSVSLYQITCSALIRVDEVAAKDRWEYKAEVSFDMMSAVPKPFLSTTEPPLPDGRRDPLRRHTRNPFPPGRVVGAMRRPDVIIVKDFGVLWPGRATEDHEGVAHPDNLMRVVEIKFPGDSFTRDQERDYEAIAGGPERLSVLDVADCDEDERKEREKERENERKTAPQGKALPKMPPLPLMPPAGGNGPQPQPVQRPRPIGPTTVIPLVDNGARRIPAPVFGRQPMPDPVWYQQLGDAAREVTDTISNKLSQLSLDFREELSKLIPWLREAGRWVEDKAQSAWTWVNEKGEELGRWTVTQLREALEELRRAGDFTWEQLKQAEWGDIIAEGAKWVAVTILVVGAVVICVFAFKVLAALLAWFALVAAGALTFSALATA